MNLITKIRKYAQNCAMNLLHTISQSRKRIHTSLAVKYAKIITFSPLLFMASSLKVSAEGPDANAVIQEILGLLQEWIPVMGGLVVIVGAIQLGVSFKDDNADGKTRGIQTMIGGAIITAIAALITL
jgi:hypothetical protein